MLAPSVTHSLKIEHIGINEQQRYHYNTEYLEMCRRNKFGLGHGTLRRVIPVVCVTGGREESVFNQHNLFRKMLYSNNETTCFGL